MREIIKRVLGDSFMRNSATYFTGSMLVAFVNYLFHPILSRLTTVSVFGEVQTLISLLAQVTIVLSGFTAASVHASANCEQADERAAIVNALRGSALAVVGIIAGAFILGSGIIASLLNFQSALPFILLSGPLIASALYSTRIGYLQGQTKFLSVSLANLLVSFGKLIFAAFFVFLGWQSAGAIGGIIVGQILGLTFVYFKTRDALHPSIQAGYALSKNRYWGEMGYAGLVFCSMLFVTMLYTADLLVIKHYFSPEVAGLYSGIFTVGNIVIFSASPITAVVLASIKRKHDPVQNRRLFTKGLIVLLGLGGCVTLIFAFLPDLVMRILLGNRYLPFAHLLPTLSVSYLLASLTNLFVVYGIALRKRGLLVLAGSGSLLLVLLTLLRHSTVESVIHNFIMVSGFALLGAMAVSWRSLWSKS